MSSRFAVELGRFGYMPSCLFRSRRIGRGAQRSGIMPSRGLQLPTHRSRSLAIRHHAITRSDSGAQVARLDGPASCLRASPSLPLKATLGRSSPHAPAPSSFPSLSIKSKSLAVWHSCHPTYFVHAPSHAQVVTPTPCLHCRSLNAHVTAVVLSHCGGRSA